MNGNQITLTTLIKITMEDYKNEQWWIELQEAMKGFDENSMSKMSDGKLSQWHGAKIGGKTTGNKNVISGHLNKISKLGGLANVTSGNLDKIRYKGGKSTKDKFSKPIIAFDKITGEFVAEYSSAKEASRILNKPAVDILKAVKGKRKTMYGFIWKYKDSI
jgi:hypothetical protein